MLNVTKEGPMRGTVEEQYAKLVSVRRGLKKWSMPLKWKNEITRVADYLTKRKITTPEAIHRYLDAQFVFWNARRCLQLFHTPYPPLPVMRNDKAMYRYEKNELTNAKPLPETVASLKRRVAIEVCGMNGLPTVDAMVFSVLSGQIGYTTLAFLHVSGSVEKAYVKDVLSVLDGVEENAYDKYNNAVYKAAKMEGVENGTIFEVTSRTGSEETGSDSAEDKREPVASHT